MTSRSINQKSRVRLIRKGNELFQKGQVELAGKIFLAIHYQDGLKRVGDHYFYEKRLPIKALEYYQASGFKERVEEFCRRSAAVIQKLLSEDNK